MRAGNINVPIKKGNVEDFRATSITVTASREAMKSTRNIPDELASGNPTKECKTGTDRNKQVLWKRLNGLKMKS